MANTKYKVSIQDLARMLVESGVLEIDERKINYGWGPLWEATLKSSDSLKEHGDRLSEVCCDLRSEISEVACLSGLEYQPDTRSGWVRKKRKARK